MRCCANKPALVQDVGRDETDRGNAQNRQERAVEQDVREAVVGINIFKIEAVIRNSDSRL
jgi:hypothetical protein